MLYTCREFAENVASRLKGLDPSCEILIAELRDTSLPEILLETSQRRIPFAIIVMSSHQAQDLCHVRYLFKQPFQGTRGAFFCVPVCNTDDV
jgi:hypothetical protein